MSENNKVTRDVPVLADVFDVKEHLKVGEAKAQELKFFGKVLGRRGGSLFCESFDGVYEFPVDQVTGVRPVNALTDELFIRREASVTLHTTMARWLRARQAQATGGPPGPSTPQADMAQPPGGYPGHEWRG